MENSPNKRSLTTKSIQNFHCFQGQISMHLNTGASDKTYHFLSITIGFHLRIMIWQNIYDKILTNYTDDKIFKMYYNY